MCVAAFAHSVDGVVHGVLEGCYAHLCVGPRLMAFNQPGDWTMFFLSSWVRKWINVVAADDADEFNRDVDDGPDDSDDYDWVQHQQDEHMQDEENDAG